MIDRRGADLRARRLARGLSVRGLAELSRVDRATITRAEEGHPSTTDLTYSRLEQALDGAPAPVAVPTRVSLANYRVDLLIDHNAEPNPIVRIELEPVDDELVAVVGSEVTFRVARVVREVVES